jgi:peptidyl-tRNA hydrolase
LYILVNDKLTKSQRIPQASHAVAEFMHHHKNDQSVSDWVENHRTMVCLKSTEDFIGNTMETMLRHKIPYSSWHDEDLVDCEWASIAIGPMTQEVGNKYFKELKLA